jgi:hypothetical protein
MKVVSVLSLGALVGGVLGQTGTTFEPVEFNITEALIENGVDVTAIPELSGLVERSSSKACSAAVSTSSYTLEVTVLLSHYLVYIVETYLRS